MAGVVKTTSPIRRNRTNRMFMTGFGTNPGSFLDGRFVDQHHRNVVLDGIHPVARVALQAGAVMHEHHGCFEVRASKYLEQFGIEGHSESTSRNDKTITERAREP